MSTTYPTARDEIAKLLPHAGAMVLLERVIAADKTSLSCETNTHRDPANPLREEQGLPAATGIEYAAQAAALHAALFSSNQAPKEGVLAVASNINWTIDRLDLCAAPLRISVTLTDEMAGSRRYSFSLESDGAKLVAGEILLAL